MIAHREDGPHVTDTSTASALMISGCRMYVQDRERGALCNKPRSAGDVQIRVF